ncbi:hypothetical protein KEM54_005973 [Ascosphaera aggregata]|nr:hypothetical protein KEM54_005973 [Ascosphaera aggregata]
MFYSHEVLTSRKHGVATVWLVATLGSKSITQKVNRKAIMDVDVPKACDTVVRPDAPLALRLQGNLLFGISRVYDQQCGYALTDVQHMRDKMTTVYRHVRNTTALDPEAGKAKRDQLILHDDPSFIPSNAIPGLNDDLDINDLISGKPTAARHYLSSQLQSSFSLNSSSLAERGLKLDLSSSDVVSALNGLGLASDMSSAQCPNELRIELSDIPPGYQEEKGLLLENDFEFDEDGNIVDLPAQRASRASPWEHMGRKENGVHDIGEDAWLNDHSEDSNLNPGDEEQRQKPPPPQEELVIANEQQEDSATPTAQRPSILDSEYVPVTEEISETTASAKEQQKRSPRKRTFRCLETDLRPELRNSHLLEWNEEYLRNMARAKRMKILHKQLGDARRNAATWVLERGLGDVGSKIGEFGYDHILEMYAGGRLLDKLSKEEPRRVKNESGDGVNKQAVDGGVRHESENGNDMIHDEANEIEIGRNAPPSILDDYSSQMPWNVTTSARGGSHPGSSIHSRRFVPSLGGFSSASNHPGLMGRMSRMTSSSPLAGRGRLRNGLAESEDEMNIDVDYPGLETSSGNALGGLDAGYPSSDAGHMAMTKPGQQDSYELRGLAAAIDTQAASEPQWLRGVFEQESLNFLEFVRTRGDEIESEESNDGMISFSQLLPPQTSTRVVATQALMHVLSLATRGLLKVEQDESSYITDKECVMGEIYLQLAL